MDERTSTNMLRGDVGYDAKRTCIVCVLTPVVVRRWVSKLRVPAWPAPRVLLSLVLALAILVLLPCWWCGRDGHAYFDGESAAQTALANQVVDQLNANPRLQLYAGGSRFAGQSAIAVYQMSILGMGQLVHQHPELRDQYLPSMRAAANKMVDPRTHPYAAERYGRNGLVALGAGQGHAYLGYVNLALGMLRSLDKSTRHAALHDRLTAHFVRELSRSPQGMVDTYPGESWPPDVAAVVASIGMHGRAPGAVHSQMLKQWAKRFAPCAIDDSGYMIQRLRSGSCEVKDAPRGSGTALSAYFLRFASPELARQLYAAQRDVGTGGLFGFAAVREYAPGFDGIGDVNAGPVVLGYSVGATGFGLGAARAHGDRAGFVALYRTTHLFGLPHDDGDKRSFLAGGLLGNALLLAMLTAEAK